MINSFQIKRSDGASVTFTIDSPDDDFHKHFTLSLRSALVDKYASWVALTQRGITLVASQGLDFTERPAPLGSETGASDG